MKRIPYIRNLIIEVTRRCNLECKHCLRGDAEKMDMKKAYIDCLLDSVEDINGVTFTGGEPSLNVSIIEYFLDSCKARGITISYFYIATNGVLISEDFVIACLKLYSYSDEKDVCLVNVSNDGYHSKESSYNTELLDGLSFFKRKFSKEGEVYPDTVLAEGRGANLGYRSPGIPSDIETLEDFEDAEIYLNCYGQVVNGCDWSYDTQDSDEQTLCDVKDLNKFYNQLE